MNSVRLITIAAVSRGPPHPKSNIPDAESITSKNWPGFDAARAETR